MLDIWISNDHICFISKYNNSKIFYINKSYLTNSFISQKGLTIAETIVLPENEKVENIDVTPEINIQKHNKDGKNFFVVSKYQKIKYILDDSEFEELRKTKTIRFSDTHWFTNITTLTTIKTIIFNNINHFTTNDAYSEKNSAWKYSKNYKWKFTIKELFLESINDVEQQITISMEEILNSCYFKKIMDVVPSEGIVYEIEENIICLIINKFAVIIDVFHKKLLCFYENLDDDSNLCFACPINNHQYIVLLNFEMYYEENKLQRVMDNIKYKIICNTMHVSNFNDIVWKFE